MKNYKNFTFNFTNKSNNERKRCRLTCVHQLEQLKKQQKIKHRRRADDHLHSRLVASKDNSSQKVVFQLNFSEIIFYRFFLLFENRISPTQKMNFLTTSGVCRRCRENAMWEALTVFASFGRPFHRIVLFIILLFIVWPRNEMENSKFIACRSRRSFTQLRQWCRCDQKPLFLIVDQNEFCPKNANRTKVEIQLSQSQSTQSIRCGFSLFFFLLFRVIHELVHTQTYARAVSLTVNKLCWNQMSGKPYVLFSRSCAMSAWKTS